jgi:hypothetical protein
MRPVLDEACGHEVLGVSRNRQQARPNQLRFIVLPLSAEFSPGLKTPGPRRNPAGPLPPAKPN